MTTEKTTVDAKKLTDFTARVLQGLDVPEEDARITAHLLVASDLRGVDSHGVAHLKMFYARRIRMGIINLHPKIEVFSHTPAAATMEGDQGLGFVVGHRAMIEAIGRAEATGIGFIAVRNSTHFGAAAVYAMMALEHDMIGISATNTATSVVAPGTATAAVGTNPIAIAVPAGKHPSFVLDMATSVVAAGKLEVARRENSDIPAGWVVDKDGESITDPGKRMRGEGGLLPLGGIPALGSYKGFGLGVLVEILCGVLSGSSASILKESTPETRGNASDHFFGALRIDSFLPVVNFKNSMDEMIDAFESLPKLSGVNKIHVAGGYEDEINKDRKANGIPLNGKVIQELQELAQELNIDYDL